MNYSDDIIRFAFRHERPDVSNPGSERLTRFDGDLFVRFDSILVSELTSQGLDTDKRTRSQIMLLALMTNGATDALKVRSAVRYFVNVTG